MSAADFVKISKCSDGDGYEVHQQVKEWMWVCVCVCFCFGHEHVKIIVLMVVKVWPSGNFEHLKHSYWEIRMEYEKLRFEMIFYNIYELSEKYPPKEEFSNNYPMRLRARTFLTSIQLPRWCDGILSKTIIKDHHCLNFMCVLLSFSLLWLENSSRRSRSLQSLFFFAEIRTLKMRQLTHQGKGFWLNMSMRKKMMKPLDDLASLEPSFPCLIIWNEC